MCSSALLAMRALCPVRSAQGGRRGVACFRQGSSLLRSVPGLAGYWGVASLRVPSTDMMGGTAFVSCAICLGGLSKILDPWLWASCTGAASGSDSFLQREQQHGHTSLPLSAQDRGSLDPVLQAAGPPHSLVTPVRADRCHS